LISLFRHYKGFVECCVDPEFRELVTVEPPKEATFGDFSTNIAMVLAKKIKRSPTELAQEISERLLRNDHFEKVEVKKPGFINWFVPKRVLINHVPDMLRKNFGKSDFGEGRSINVEYVSANPTGSLHAGHVRGAVSGDVLANLLRFVGYKVTKEYYINDAGRQVDILARSLHYKYLEQLGKVEGSIYPADGYPGEYLTTTARKVIADHGDKFVGRCESEWLDFFRRFAISDMMVRIKEDLNVLAVHHDVFSSESALVKNGAVERAIAILKDKGLVYRGVLARPKGGGNLEEWEEREQLLFKSTVFGDDVDRPLQKSDGSWTYFATDVAYHMHKINRRFDEMVNFWGADHGGYVKRMQAAVLALSDGAKKLEVKLIQLVRLLENGNEARMSKRTGTFVSAKDIVKKVGKDVVRFIMLTRRDDVPLDFDFKKVVDQSRDNPIFYVQYAYARSHSVMRLFRRTFPAKTIPTEKNADLTLLDHDDLPLIKVLADWPRQVIMAAQKREPHRIAFFLSELAAVFHSFWNQGKESHLLRFVIPENFEKTCARLVLLTAMQNVMETAFSIIGVTPLEELR
jgi:arginyl-tRNA synthetase